MSFRYFICSVIFILPFSVFAVPIENMPGTTLKEREIRWVWKYLNQFTRSCTLSEQCSKPEVTKAMTLLDSYFPKTPQKIDSAWNKRLQFLSEKENPGIFKTGENETHRLAVTEKTKDAVIYINTDRMNLPIWQWVGILTHEATHNIGYEDGSERLPDIVGAAVAAHFNKNSVISDLAEFAHSDIQLVIFNSQLEITTPSVLHIDGLTIDVSTAPADGRVCEENENLLSQFVPSFLWKIRRIQSEQKVVSLRTTGMVFTKCKNAEGKIREFIESLVFRFDLKYQDVIDFQKDWWNKPSIADRASILFGTSDSPMERMNTNRTFMVKSVDHEKKTLHAGETWKTKIILKNLDQYTPTTCQIYLTGKNWAFHSYMDLPAILTFNSCALKPLGESLWELTGSFEFPKNAQPDSFFVNAVRLPAQNPEVDGDRFAFTAFPSFVQVINENTPGRLKIKSWGALDLEIAKKYENLVLKDSYKIIFDQPFWVEVDVEGSQNIGTEFIDFDLFVEYMGEVYIRPHSGRIDYMKPFILQWEKVKRADNIQRLRYQLIVPSNPNETGGLKVLGFKIRRLYAPADDFSWLEHNMPDYNQGMFLSDKLK